MNLSDIGFTDHSIERWERRFPGYDIAIEFSHSREWSAKKISRTGQIPKPGSVYLVGRDINGVRPGFVVAGNSVVTILRIIDRREHNL